MSISATFRGGFHEDPSSPSAIATFINLEYLRMSRRASSGLKPRFTKPILRDEVAKPRFMGSLSRPRSILRRRKENNPRTPGLKHPSPATSVRRYAAYLSAEAALVKRDMASISTARRNGFVR